MVIERCAEVRHWQRLAALIITDVAVRGVLSHPSLILAIRTEVTQTEEVTC
jgi:hypothetical protein